MSQPLARVLRSLATLTVLAVALTGLQPLGPATAMPIEGYPSYQPQTNCSPRAKPGTVMLAEHLIKRYPGSGSSGISRSCGSSGVSEHKEGRAFDWSLSARSGRDRAYAQDFLDRIRATDRRGHRNALARRMGIMYVIWKDHIWSSSSGYRRSSYRHSACRGQKLSRCSVTLRHRDHMHISLTRRAAQAKTSWYVHQSAPTKTKKGKKKASAKAKAKKKATAKAEARATAKARAKARAKGATARAKAKATATAERKATAKAKKRVKATAKAKTRAKAKAKAKKKAKRKAGKRARSKAERKAKKKANKRAEAAAKKKAKAKAERKAKRKAERKATKKAERKRSRAERRAAAKREQARTAERARRLPPGVLDLRKHPYRRIGVPAHGEVVETRYKLREGVTYSLTAAGLYSYGSPRQVGDAVCTWSPREKGWTSKPGRRTKRRFGRLALLVNGKRLFGDECRGGHTYRTTITPSKDRPLRVRVAGRHPTSSGRLVVVVARKRAKVADALPTYPDITPAPSRPTSAPDGFGLISETVTVPATGGVHTSRSLRPGATYRLTVSGVVGLGGGVSSNGQCLAVRGTWYRKASMDLRVPDQDHGNLYVDGVPFDGRANGQGCSTNSHTAEHVADRRGRLRLDLWDPHDRSDNQGSLTVKVQRVTPIRVPGGADRERPRSRRPEWSQSRDRFEVSAGRRRGKVSTMRLRKGEVVRVVARGRFRSHGRVADASCVRTAAGWGLTDPDVLGQDPLNLWVDGREVRWRALGRTSGCSDEARYSTRFVARKNGPLRLSVFDLDHRDNKGSLEVTLRRLKR